MLSLKLNAPLSSLDIQNIPPFSTISLVKCCTGKLQRYGKTVALPPLAICVCTLMPARFRAICQKTSISQTMAVAASRFQSAQKPLLQAQRLPCQTPRLLTFEIESSVFFSGDGPNMMMFLAAPGTEPNLVSKLQLVAIPRSEIKCPSARSCAPN